jgi:ketosteroid isomerase-like protein
VSGTTTTDLRRRPRRLAIRTLDERLAVRAPWLFNAVAKRVARLPVRSRVRRYLLARRTIQGYQAVNRGDLDVLLAVYLPDVITSFDPASGLTPADLAGEHEGHDGFRLLWDAWNSAWENLRFDPRELVDAGDRLLVTVDVSGRGAGSGIEIEMTYYEVYTLRDGRIARHENFLARAAALEAVGLAGGS